MLKNILKICAVITAVGGAFAVGHQLDSRYATAGEIEEVEQKVKMLSIEQKRHLVKEDMKAVQTRLWAMEDRWAEKYSAQTGHLYDTLEILKAFMTPEAREQFRDLEKQFADLEERLEALSPKPVVEANTDTTESD